MKTSKSIRTGLIICLISFVYSAFSQVSLPELFSDNMMFQREIPINIWGWAEKNERIEIQFNSTTYKTKADKNGEWMIELPEMKAGGPFELTVKGQNTITLSNILIGDIWVCSGQSNMEWSVSNSNNADEEVNSANFPRIRLLQVEKKISTVPLDNISEATWKECSPESVEGFSAVGYFFGRKLFKETDVPIGLIGSNWGGTVVETWISKEGLAGEPTFEKIAQDVGSIDLEKEMNKGQQNADAWLKSFKSEDAGIENGKYVWSNPDIEDPSWHEIHLPQTWESSEINDLKNLDGVVWFKKVVSLTKDQAESAAMMSLGPIDDSDITWVNGVKIGETYNKYDEKRKYVIPEGTLETGENLIVVRVEDYQGGGGLFGDSEQLFIKTGVSGDISIAGTWKYKIGMKPKSGNPNSQFGPNSKPTLLYNGMIEPLINFPIKGAIWYQGESNTMRAYQYRDLFKRLINDWRNKWGIGDFPFLWVQLANFKAPVDQPGQSDWAELREAQDMALVLSKTGMASAIDIGEANDIHPRNKQEVGRRLALAALHMEYGKNDLVYSGPRYKSMKIENAEVYVEFNNVGEGLITKDKYGYLKGFTIAGKNKKFYWAKAEIVDQHMVKIYSDKVPNPVAVRYGWADNPDKVNLYNYEGLPTDPFRTDDWPGMTYGNK